MTKKHIIWGGMISLLAVVAYANTTSGLLPTSDGDYRQWTPKSGSTHYTQVDESSCNGTSDYNSTNSVGNRDSYGLNLTEISNGSQITKIEIKPCASRNANGNGSATLNVFYRLNSVSSADAGAYSLTGTTPVELASTAFNGLSVIKTSATTLQSGVVLTSGNKGARLSRIATTVTFTPLASPTNLVAVPTSTQIGLTWNDNSTFEDNFVIERRNVTASTTFATLATVSTNTVSYNDAGVVASTTYSYRVRASNIGGYSPYSNTANALYSGLPPYSQSAYYSQSGYYAQSAYYSQSSYYAQSVYYSQASYSTTSPSRL